MVNGIEGKATLCKQHDWRIIATRVTLATLAVLPLVGCLESAEDQAAALAPEATASQPQAPAPANNPPTITGTPPTQAQVGQNYTFTPQASDPDGDALTFSVQGLPAWATFESSTGRIMGEPGEGDVGSTAAITVSVSDGTASDSLNAFSIDVLAISLGSVTLSWTAPTENEDGSQLTDLAGFKLYYGTESGNYSETITLDNPGLTTYVVENLAARTWYFSATAFDSSAVESDFSTEISRLVE